MLAWAKHDRVFSVNADSPEPGDVFNNKAIGRECGFPAFPVALWSTSGSAAVVTQLLSILAAGS